jgi:hypothetical protein
VTILRKKLVVVAMILVIAVSFAGYAWARTCAHKDGGVRADKRQETPISVTKFTALINGMSSIDVSVCVNVSDGLTEDEAELIVGTAFILVMGDYVTHRLDTLTFDDSQVTAHYTWGHDENDMGHIFDVTADLTTLQMIVSHCF